MVHSSVLLLSIIVHVYFTQYAVLEFESNERMSELSPEERATMKEENQRLMEDIRLCKEYLEEANNKLWAHEIKLSQALKDVCR